MDSRTVKSNVALFREMITCNADIYYRCYDGGGNLLEDSSPADAIFFTVFSAFGGLDALYQHGRDSSLPITFGTPVGLNWFAAYQKQGDAIQYIYLFGPLFYTDVSYRGIEQALAACPELDISIAWKKELMRAMEKVPVLSTLILNQYLVMLHYCVTGEKIRVSDVSSLGKDEWIQQEASVEKDRHKIWNVEQMLMRAVREGDLNYQEVLGDSARMSSGVPVQASDPLRQAKDSVIVSISLCSRAAIEGGLSPEQAYSVGDAYIQSVEDCRSNAALGGIHNTMLDDFIHRVRRVRANPGISRQVRRCCDYIETHAEDNLSISLLAARTGYTEYYFSRKFKAEMGITVNDYIKKTRIERAKFLLTTTDESIQDLASRLNFCSRSHFGEVFRKHTGCSPVEYRERQGKI